MVSLFRNIAISWVMSSFDEECVIMCEHGRDVVLPEEIGGFRMIKDRSYGTVGVSIFSGKTGREEADALV